MLYRYGARSIVRLACYGDSLMEWLDDFLFAVSDLRLADYATLVIMGVAEIALIGFVLWVIL